MVAVPNCDDNDPMSRGYNYLHDQIITLTSDNRKIDSLQNCMFSCLLAEQGSKTSGRREKFYTN